MRVLRLLSLFILALPLFAEESRRYIVEFHRGAIAPQLHEDAPRLRVRRQFSRTFRGAAIELQPGQSIADIEQLPYVAGVYRDEIVHAYGAQLEGVLRFPPPGPLAQDDSVAVRASAGNGVVVAVLDTGIDRTHPALQGKVIGGWDFVNDDADAMDDNRHGTHVAGIIAAESNQVTGVAPGVSLLAYKVLNAGGNGNASGIIAALERALDPNGDGSTVDRADIANLSLGTRGHPDDPLSRAVENAIAHGMVVVVAAGNDALNHMIGTPAGAPSAITVGASFRTEQQVTMVAEFSTRGPATQSGAIKPDLLAPGVNVLSTGLNHQFIQLSGTSMATPYVAGHAALLLEQHPDWTPARIKAALVTTAIPLPNEEVMTQGTGNIDVARAVANEVVAAPTQLNFGLDGTTAATWNASRRINVRNEGTTARTIRANVTGTSAAIAIAFEPAEFTLAPGESRDVDVTIDVDHALLGKPATPSFSFGGLVTLQWDGDAVRLPWNFIRSGRVTVHFDGAFPLVAWTTEEEQYASYMPITANAAEVLVEPGEYDLYVAAEHEGSVWLVVREQQHIEGDLVLPLSAADAPHAVQLAAGDERGIAFPEGNGTTTLHSKFVRLLLPNGNGLVLPAPGASLFYSSPFSERIGLLATQAYVDTSTRTMYVAQHAPIRNLDGDATLVTSPADYASQELRLRFPAGVTKREVSIRPRDWPRRIYELGPIPSLLTTTATGDEWIGTLYMTREQHPDYVGGLQFAASTDRDQPGLFGMNTPVIRRNAHGFFATRGFDETELPVYAVAGEALEFGSGVLHSYARLTANENGLSGDPELAGARNEIRRAEKETTTYRVKDAGGAEVAKGTVGVGSFFAPLHRRGRFTAELNVNRYELDGRPGTATLTAGFDTTNGTAYLPTLTSLAILDGQGRHATTLPRNGNGTLVFSAAAHEELSYRRVVSDATNVFFRRRGTNTWVQLTPVQLGEEDGAQEGQGRPPAGVIYRVDLADALRLPEGEIELRIEVSNDQGNTAAWQIAPAFVTVSAARTIGRRRSVR
ncbi:MAG TPA: S8 family serine peptidase [Thermoanaerobaculia bacterium]|nr:S8 family serine peptidase [Thermoanaerobaculia bacterium]